MGACQRGSMTCPETVKLCWSYGERRGAGTSGFIPYTAPAVVRSSAASHEKVTTSDLERS